MLIFLGFLSLTILIVVLLIVYFVGLWNLFKKAGKNGWEAIVPFYNNFVLVEIAGLNWWYALIIILSSFSFGRSLQDVEILLSLGSIVANFFICYNLSKKFHKDIGFAILMTIFPFVMIPLVGLSKNYQYDSNVIVSKNGPIDEKNYNQEQNYDTNKYCSYCGNLINSNSKYCGNCGNEIK